MRKERSRWPIWLWLGLVVIFFSSLLLFLGSPFMKDWYYVFVWWGFIAFLDGFNFAFRRESFFSRSPSEFFFFAFLSVSWWCFFEVINLRLRNWSYHDLPLNQAERWVGYFLAFATVIPAIKELEELFTYFLKKRRCRLFRIEFSRSVQVLFLVIGGGCIVLPLLWPRLFFPLIWLAFIFLFEPLNHKLGFSSLLNDLVRNDWRKFWSIVLAGFTAGFFWEFWNFWAGSHWEYSLPYLNFLRLFQMPVLGYTGFLPFAWETIALVWLIEGLLIKINLRQWVKAFLFLFFIAVDFLSFTLIDKYTLLSF